MHSLACSPAERITVKHGMIFGMQSDADRGYSGNQTCTVGIYRKKIPWLLRMTVKHGMILGVQSDEVHGYSGLMQATSQNTLTPAHINVGSIDVVTPSLI